MLEITTRPDARARATPASVTLTVQPSPDHSLVFIAHYQRRRWPQAAPGVGQGAQATATLSLRSAWKLSMRPHNTTTAGTIPRPTPTAGIRYLTRAVAPLVTKSRRSPRWSHCPDTETAAYSLAVNQERAATRIHVAGGRAALRRPLVHPGDDPSPVAFPRHGVTVARETRRPVRTSGIRPDSIHKRNSSYEHNTYNFKILMASAFLVQPSARPLLSMTRCPRGWGGRRIGWLLRFLVSPSAGGLAVVPAECRGERVG